MLLFHYSYISRSQTVDGQNHARLDLKESSEFTGAWTVTSGAGACPSMQQRRIPLGQKKDVVQVEMSKATTYQCPSIKTVGECWCTTVWLLLKKHTKPITAWGCRLPRRVTWVLRTESWIRTLLSHGWFQNDWHEFWSPWKEKCPSYHPTNIAMDIPLIQ